MSRFSSLDGQHAASRELERQRLERKIGQLRREVEVKEPVGERKFKPPGRRPHGALRRPGEALASHVAAAARARPVAQPAEPLEPGAAERPGGADVADGAPSLEMAWLLSRQRQMDEDAREVEALLLRHDLGRYVSVLARDPGGRWGSLPDLRLSDEAALVAAGLPAADARRLLAALREEGAAAAEPGTAPPRRVVVPEAEGLAEPLRWGRLGRAPPGWGRPCSAQALPAAAARADAACGGDGDCAEGAEDEQAGPRPWSAASSSTAAAQGAAEAAARRAPAPPPPPSGAGPPAPAAGAEAPALASRPATGRRTVTPASGSRPGTASSAAGAEKACCYQCYRQVYRAHAVCREGREFCGEPCAAALAQALAERAARELELGQLRAAASRAATPCGRPPP